MNNKLMATAICLVMACAMMSAQEKTQINLQDSLSHLYPETNSWTFGLTFFTGIDGTYFPNYGHNCPSNPFTDYDVFWNLGFYTQYQLTDRSSLRAELNAGGIGRLAPQFNIQYGYRFSKRWTVYGGMAVEYETRNNQWWSSGEDPQFRSLIPRAQVGIRYQASKAIHLDMRYQHDITKRTQIQNLSDSVGRIGTLSLGLGIKF